MATSIVNTALLNEAIKKSGYLKSYLATQLKITPTSLSTKLRGKNGFSSEEAYRLKIVLSLTDEEFIKIFFTPCVNQQSTKEAENGF